MLFSEWLADFIVDKTEILITEASKYPAHSVRRFSRGCEVWEIAITYTNKLIIRFGRTKIGEDEVAWSDWRTEHKVIIHPNEGEA